MHKPIESAEEFRLKVRNLRPGTRIVYHVGNLLYDREQDKWVHRRAQIAWEAYEAGQALLLQRRTVGSADVEYLLHKI